jgi:transcription termination/antitermination protein NusG
MEMTTLKPIAPYVVGNIVGYVERPKMGQEQWVLGHCVGKADSHVTEVLKRFKVEEYYPQIREFRPVPRKQMSQKQRQSGVVIKRLSLVPLLPRYRMLHIDLRRKDMDQVFEVAGIGGLVCSGGAVVQIDQKFIDAVHKLETDGAIPGSTQARIVFKLGEEVRIAGRGPFAGFNAIVDESLDVPIETLDPDTRIKVAIALFGRPSRTSLPLTEVEKL